MPDWNERKSNGGPWWTRLGTAAMAIAGLVYLGDTLGGRFLDILAADLAAERATQRQLVGVLERSTHAAEETELLAREQLEVERERNRILNRLLEELRERRRANSTQ